MIETKNARPVQVWRSVCVCLKGYVKTQATTISRPCGWLGRRRRRGVVAWLNISSGNITESESIAIGKIKMTRWTPQILFQQSDYRTPSFTYRTLSSEHLSKCLSSHVPESTHRSLLPDQNGRGSDNLAWLYCSKCTRICFLFFLLSRADDRGRQSVFMFSKPTHEKKNVKCERSYPPYKTVIYVAVSIFRHV